MGTHAIRLSVYLGMLSIAMAALPEHLTNFQNEFACNTSVRIVRPENVEDVQEAVLRHDIIVPVGQGHSWNKPFFCANVPDERLKPTRHWGRRFLDVKQAPTNKVSAANIVVPTMRPLKISVDEESQSVWVDAGVILADLLKYLGNYVTEAAPAGYSLPATPWFIFQSVGGALATGTHGSSLTYGSLSNQALAFQVVLANGTLAEISEESDPFLMKALRVSVGRLGIVTAAKMKIVKEVPVKRSLRRGISLKAFLSMLREAQEMYKKNRSLPEWMVESQLFWLVQLNEIALYSFQRGDSEDPAVRHEVLKDFKPEQTTQYKSLLEMLEVEGDPKVPADRGMVLENGVFKTASEFLADYNVTHLQKPVAVNRTEDGGDVADGVSWTEPEQLLANLIYGSSLAGIPLLSSNYVALSSILGNATVEAHMSYIAMPERMLPSLIKATLYDQYELAIPINQVADCMEGAFKIIHDGHVPGLDEFSKEDLGFRTAPLIRFIGRENAFLSTANDIPRMYINLEDYIFYNRHNQRNEKFFKLVAHLRGNPACAQTRLHWGKAGWPEYGCWHGASEFKDTWCDFGCAVKQLDPFQKFQDSATDRWNWEGADLEYCCTDTGYDRSKEGCTCNVRRIRTTDDCPPSPYYTDR